MTDPQSDPFGSLDGAVCRCSRCTGPQTLAWPEWATPSSDGRRVETVVVVGGRL